MISRKTEIRTGKLYKETIWPKGKGKIQIKKNMPVDLYGGYLNYETSFLVMVKFNNKTKIIGIPMNIAYEFNKNQNIIKEFIKNHLGEGNFEILKKQIPYETEFVIKNHPVYIKGYGIQNKTCEVSNALQLKFNKQQLIKWKYTFNRLLNDRANTKQYPDLIYKEELRDILKELYKVKKDYPLFKSSVKKIEDRLIVDNLKIEELEKVISELFKLYHCNSVNADLSSFGLGNRIGRLSGINISNGKIISSSCTSIKRKNYEF